MDIELIDHLDILNLFEILNTKKTLESMAVD